MTFSPTSAVMYIVGQESGSVTSQGSCAQIGRRHVLTASHAIGGETPLTNIRFSLCDPAASSAAPIYQAAAVHFNALGIVGGSESMSQACGDFGVACSATELPNTGCFGLYPIDQMAFSEVVDIYGYPQGAPLMTASGAQLAGNAATTNGLFYAQAGIEGGDSGGPAVYSNTINGVSVQSIAGVTTAGAATYGYVCGMGFAQCQQVEAWMAADGWSPLVDRLYCLFKGALADSTGLNYWSKSINAGTDSLVTVAADFISLLGLSPQDVLSRCYYNMLLRAPDAAGEAYWLAQMTGSAPAMTAAQVAVCFVSCPAAIAAHGYYLNRQTWGA